jgi:hypothetical protein
MAYTSGSTAFNLDLTELVEEAFERCGSEMRSGYDLKTARRSINLLSIEWANRGINLWTVEEVQIPLVAGQVCYALPANTIDLLDMVTRTNNSTSNQQDINISRISESTYATIPNKLAQGRPIQVWINRQSGNTNLTSSTLSSSITSTATSITLNSVVNLASSGFIQIDSEVIYYANTNGNTLVNCARGQNNTTAAAHNSGAVIYVAWLPSINVYPTPDGSTSYNFVAWRMRRVQDAGTGVNIQDIPFRFIPCLVAGLSYYLSLKLQGVDTAKKMEIKADYEQQLQLASEEDREKAPIRFVPRNFSYSR